MLTHIVGLVQECEVEHEGYAKNGWITKCQNTKGDQNWEERNDFFNIKSNDECQIWVDVNSQRRWRVRWV